ncbi:MAG: phage recombination protein Bet [Dehalococcoidales bacterium]
MENKTITNIEALITRGRPKDAPLMLTIDRVRREICHESSLTDLEIIDFLNICQAEQLDPLRKEILLIKNPGQPAYYVITLLGYLKMAENNAAYKGHQAGVVGKTKDGPCIYHEGELIDETETLKGGWARVWRTDRDKPIYSSVNLQEYIKRTQNGEITDFWDDHPAAMIRKIALSKALREAFPNRFSMSVTDAEFEVVSSRSNQSEEFTLPESFMKDNEVEWRKVYARLKEMGLGHDEACQLLNIKSIKQDWMDRGQTIGDFIDAVAEALTKRGRQESTGSEAQKNLSPQSSTSKTVPIPDSGDIMFDQIDSPAIPPYKAAEIQDPVVDEQWVIETIKELQKKGCADVSPAKLKDRFLNLYHLQQPLAGVKDALSKLAPQRTSDFCKWLNQLQEK